ncbi:MAG: hypothetical protein RLZZ505_1638 [Verrucomicrobiota bacterium]|jgi:hypothetical protein
MVILNAKPNALRHRRPSLRFRGFALIVTLSLMILLSILAVGLLSLSSVSLRNSAAGSDLSIAKGNARLALLLAMGELQKQAGSDTRVTASAEVLNKTNTQDLPRVLGVWKSWEGTDHELTGSYAGRPVSPGNYENAKKERFLAWLTSAPGTADAPPDTKKALGKVALVGPGSVGTGLDREKLQIHLTPTTINTNGLKGSYAWWIGGENQKARITKPYEPNGDTVAGWATQMKGHSVADPKPFRMENIIGTPALADKMISPGQGDLIATAGDMKASTEFFHDFSASSVGLLTNTATGGWRKDFSLLTENWAKQPKTNLPFFRVKPGEDLFFNLPTRGGDYKPSRALIYPWSEYRNPSQMAIYQMGAVSSWECLSNFATIYKSMKRDGAAIDVQFAYTDDNNALSNFDYHHKIRILPVFARTQWVFSHWAADPPEGSPAGTLEARLLVTPVFTIWNPYNVEIRYALPGPGTTRQTLTFWQRATLPNAFRYKVGSVANTRFNSLLNTTSGNTPYLMESISDPRAGPWNGTLVYSIKNTFTLKPGQTILFSPVGSPATPDTELELRPGYRPTSGHYFPLVRDDKSKIIVPANTSMEAEARFDSTFNDGVTGVGLYLDMLTMPGTGTNYTYRTLAYRMVANPAVTAALYPPINGLAATTLAEAKLQPQPFLTTILGPRTASNTHLAGKGLVQTSPISNYTEMGKQINHSGIQINYPGTFHPINSLFDYSFRPLSAGDSFTPNSGPNNSSYIITGFESAKGLSRCVLTELPTRPLQSLPELTNWDARLDNPAPPFSYNVVGNSDASPLFPKDAVWNTENSTVGKMDLQHDDSYCMNHIFFDDWFMSSLAPYTAGLGELDPGDTLKKTYTEFLQGTTPLANRAYKAITPDVSMAAQSTAQIDALFAKHIDAADSWKSIASRLQVEGMFNVNSTSVKAWRALLGHARGQKIPYYNAAATPVLSTKKDYAFTRFSISGDVEASSPTAISGTFPGAAQFSGYRTLDDDFLNLLAEEIVNQVRQRGPFLSLAEFVNRQLSSNETLAVGGAIQVALDTLAKNSATNIYAGLQSPGTAATANPPSAAQAGYKFPNAAVGYNAYGLPGWTRQADVLRPLAPILSARDDTFTIRAYGDSRDSTGAIKASATCEVVVCRVRDFVDPADAAEITTLPTRATNQAFGRRFQIISFRWLEANEI